MLGAAAFAAPLHAQPAGASIDPPVGTRVVLEVKGAGVQVYACAHADSGFKWTLKGPDATLSDASGNSIGTHFAGPTWKLTDGSQVQGELIANKPAPETGAVPWLLLRARPGSASGQLASVAFIRRTETHGGVAPTTGCESAADVDKTVRAPYTANYTFYANPQ